MYDKQTQKVIVSDCEECMHKNVCKFIADYKNIAAEAEKLLSMQSAFAFLVGVKCPLYVVEKPTAR